jgi:hypothetical protein
MKSTLLDPIKLRAEIIRRIEALQDQHLTVLHHVLLLLEKENLWKELSADTETDRQLGKFSQLPKIIEQARVELRRQANAQTPS